MFKLNPNPTFWRTVQLTAADGSTAELELEYKHRSKAQWIEFASNAAGRTDDEVIGDLVVGWRKVDAEFSAENLRLLLQNYHAAAEEIAEDYKAALTESRRKN